MYTLNLVGTKAGHMFLVSGDTPYKKKKRDYSASNTLSVSVNGSYTQLFHKVIDSQHGIRWLYGKTALETKERLESAIDRLLVEDAPLAKDAARTLKELLAKIERIPEGVWWGD